MVANRREVSLVATIHTLTCGEEIYPDFKCGRTGERKRIAFGCLRLGSLQLSSLQLQSPIAKIYLCLQEDAEHWMFMLDMWRGNK